MSIVRRRCPGIGYVTRYRSPEACSRRRTASSGPLSHRFSALMRREMSSLDEPGCGPGDVETIGVPPTGTSCPALEGPSVGGPVVLEDLDGHELEQAWNVRSHEYTERPLGQSAVVGHQHRERW